MEHGYGRTVQRRARKGLLEFTNGSVLIYVGGQALRARIVVYNVYQAL